MLMKTNFFPTGIYEEHTSTITVDWKSVQTNIGLLHCDNVRVTPKKLCERLQEVSVKFYLFINLALLKKIVVELTVLLLIFTRNYKPESNCGLYYLAVGRRHILR